MSKKYCVIEINETFSPIDERYIKINGLHTRKEDAIDNILNVIDWKIDNNGNKYINYSNAVCNEKLTPESIRTKLHDYNFISHVNIYSDIEIIYRILEMNSFAE